MTLHTTRPAPTRRARRPETVHYVRYMEQIGALSEGRADEIIGGVDAPA